MAFNKGYELKKFEAHWEKLRIEYAAAGMAGDAIQKMYDYDRQQFNSERTCIERTQEFTAPAYESSEEEASQKSSLSPAAMRRKLRSARTICKPFKQNATRLKKTCSP